MLHVKALRGVGFNGEGREVKVSADSDLARRETVKQLCASCSTLFTSVWNEVASTRLSGSSAPALPMLSASQIACLGNVTDCNSLYPLPQPRAALSAAFLRGTKH